ncbi:effector-associated constant component EACC1 [Streptomyces niveus]|uniref:effector-associated constant component EACC1 n=1 Tax=Streptomyces niveus TaxID=193462 RepID=UPI0036E6498E
MEINLSFGGGTAEERDSDHTQAASSLHRWLVAEPELRGQARVAAGVGEVGEGHMGDALEVVNVVLANSIALGSLVTAVVAWRGSRARAPQVRLERNGVIVTVQDSSPETVERILAMWNGSAASGGDAE